MDIYNIVTKAYTAEWEKILNTNQKSPVLDQELLIEMSENFTAMDAVFTLDEVQRYVDEDIERSPVQARELYHEDLLSQLARLYANTLFLLFRTDNGAGYLNNNESFFEEAIVRLKKRYNNNTAYPCSNNNGREINTVDIGGTGTPFGR